MAGEAPRDSGPVDGVHPVKMAGEQSGLVRLHGADKMPGNGQIRQVFDLGHRFLNIVLGKVPLARPVGFGDRCRGHRLGNGDERYVLPAPA